MSISGRMKTSAFHPSAQGKSGTMPELSVKQAHPTATRRQDAANQHQRADARKGKADTMSAFSVKQAAANQHQRKDENLGFSSLRPRKVGQDARAFRKARCRRFPCNRRPCTIRRQDVANKHQQNSTNLGFVAFCPRKSRQDVGVFRKVSPGTQTALRCGRGLGVCGRLWLRSAGFVRGSP